MARAAARGAGDARDKLWKTFFLRSELMAVTVTWSGHSTFLIDTGSGVLLIDPFFDDADFTPRLYDLIRR